jgi:hypothetical protein
MVSLAPLGDRLPYVRMAAGACTIRILQLRLRLKRPVYRGYRLAHATLPKVQTEHHIDAALHGYIYDSRLTASIVGSSPQ